MGGKACNFISESLGWDFGDFGKDSFVDMEVVGKFLIVFFEEDLGGSFDCFSSDSTH